LLVAIILAAATIATPPTADDAAAIRFLQSTQTSSGGYVSVWPADRATARPSLRTTRTALRSFRLLGGEPADREAVLRYLKECYVVPSGGFGDYPGAPADAISTSVALMVCRELSVPLDPYLEPGLKFMNENTSGFEQIRMVAAGLEELERRVPNVDAWLREIDRARNPDGSYGAGPGQARTTALYVVAQQRLGGKPDSAEAVLQVLRAGQRSDGGFGGDAPGASDLESCYRIVRLFVRLEALPTDPQHLRQYIASCHNDDGGFGITPQLPSSLHGTYYATILRHWLDGGE
jgi:prenyltransferase beta subunit